MRKLFSDNPATVIHPIKRTHQTQNYLTCPDCGRNILQEVVHANTSICPHCEALFRMPAIERVKQLADVNTFAEISAMTSTPDLLRFPGYAEKITKAKQQSKLNEAVVTGCCQINGLDVALGVMDSYFMMGSMGTVVGNKIVQLCQVAMARQLPLILVCASGGARMQEGMHSLLQMSRTTIALSQLGEQSLLYVSVLTNPTTGGVTASFAMQGDIILAEPNALIGFAGPRVISQTVNESLPEGFQTAEYLYANGMIDGVVKRQGMKKELSKILALHRSQKK
jgi:acetyl-CoA carboxylase carboxyl transferase subunit beta